MTNYENIGIMYFTTPAMENEPIGKTVEGVMIQVGKQIPVRKVNSEYEPSLVEKMKPTSVPSIIFTDNSGKVEHLRVEGNVLSTISLDGVMGIVKDIAHYNANNSNG
tara:strand:- start:132 stop:452 length:321 start_codon:yes stop_codon:yes gene_type:complete